MPNDSAQILADAMKEAVPEATRPELRGSMFDDPQPEHFAPQPQIQPNYNNVINPYAQTDFNNINPQFYNLHQQMPQAPQMQPQQMDPQGQMLARILSGMGSK